MSTPNSTGSKRAPRVSPLSCGRRMAATRISWNCSFLRVPASRQSLTGVCVCMHLFVFSHIYSASRLNLTGVCDVAHSACAHLQGLCVALPSSTLPVEIVGWAHVQAHHKTVSCACLSVRVNIWMCCSMSRPDVCGGMARVMHGIHAADPRFRFRARARALSLIQGVHSADSRSHERLGRPYRTLPRTGVCVCMCVCARACACVRPVRAKMEEGRGTDTDRHRQTVRQSNSQTRRHTHTRAPATCGPGG